MRWKSGRRSTNIDDRRGSRVRRGFAGGGIGTLVLILVAMYFGVDPSLVMRTLQTVQTSQPRSQSSSSRPVEGSEADFVSVVLADTEDTWNAIFANSGQDYREPTLVLFSDAVKSRCGFANAAVGPFYCPADQHIYLDLSFFRELHSRFGAPGDFAQAYVIAHEVGHHVQNLLGISSEVRRRQSGMSKAAANELSVRLELQADCLSGVWARNADRARNILEAGDIDEGLGAATAIGDDTLQKRSQGYVVPDSFTHGSSAQRVRWFRRGLESGSFDACDTFSAANL
ncbi:MAG: zinc metallopeptidase [Gammaproteobacteria bacterium]|nr:zinc metallopeptidase [Gammaproteobacteria bacterium]